MYPGWADMTKQNWNDAVGNFLCSVLDLNAGGGG
jgi:hypothetical protein